MILPAPHISLIILAVAALGFAASAMAGFPGIPAPSSANGIVLAATPTRLLSSPFGASADVSVTISNGIDELETGQTVIYQIPVTSAGPSATEAVIEVGFPFGLNCAWSCSADGGASCPGPGSGNIDVPISLPAQASATFTASCVVATSIPIPPPENLMVVAEVSPTAIDPNWTDNSASDTDALIPVVDVAVSIDDGVNIVWYGHELVYQIGVFSTGADAMVRVLNPVPSTLTDCAWTCQSFIGEFCPTPSSGSGSIDAELVLPAWSGAQTEFVRFTSTCLVSPNATSNVVNTAQLELASPFRDSDLTNNQASDTDTLRRSVDLSVSVSDGLEYVQVGDVLDYVIRVDNAGPDSGDVVHVSDTLPEGVSLGIWDCIPSADATCNPGKGDTLTDVASIPAGGHATYVFSGVVQPYDFSAPMANQVVVSCGTECFEPTPTDNIAIDTDIVVIFRSDFD